MLSASFKKEVPLANDDPDIADASVDKIDLAIFLSKIIGILPEFIFLAPSLFKALSDAIFPIFFALSNLLAKRLTEIS